jgi:hypothetical protein
MRFFYVVNADRADLTIAESYSHNFAKTRVILCCDNAQPELTDALITEADAMTMVNEFSEEWNGPPMPDPPPPPGE